MVAKTSTELSVPKTASMNYNKNSTEQINLFTPTLYIGNWDMESLGHPSPSLVSFYKPYVVSEFCD